MRSIEDLTAAPDPAWSEVQDWVAASPRPVEVLPLALQDKGRCLLRLQVTTRSTLGALAWETGGLVLDHGWLRILGGGTDHLADIAGASGLGPSADDAEPPPLLVVGHDVVGGLFAVNGGALPVDLGEAAYLAPDTLEWMGLGVGHTGFVQWALGGDTGLFFGDVRWPGWEHEAARLRHDQGIALIPPLFSAQGADDVQGAGRGVVPIAELRAFLDDARRQLGALPDGARFRIGFVD